MSLPHQRLPWRVLHLFTTAQLGLAQAFEFSFGLCGDLMNSFELIPQHLLLLLVLRLDRRQLLG